MRIGSIVIHCFEFKQMVAFWQEALHYTPREPASDDWAVLCDPKGKGPNLSFQARERPAGHRSWLHLDLYTGRQADEVERLVSLGARRYPWRYPEGADYVVLEDPDGNLFCVVEKPVEMIYHIVTESDLRAHMSGDVYTPASLKDFGFVHCALQSSVIAVANDYFAEATEPVLLLEIDPEHLASEVRYEAPAPIAGGGTSHLIPAALFPHVYGPINTQAITRVGVLGVTPDGYQWPGEFEAWEAFIAARP